MTSRIFQKDLKLMKKTDLEHISHELGIPYSKNISKKRLITLLLKPLTSEYSYQMFGQKENLSDDETKDEDLDDVTNDLSSNMKEAIEKLKKKSSTNITEYIEDFKKSIDNIKKKYSSNTKKKITNIENLILDFFLIKPFDVENKKFKEERKQFKEDFFKQGITKQKILREINDKFTSLYHDAFGFAFDDNDLQTLYFAKYKFILETNLDIDRSISVYNQFIKMGRIMPYEFAIIYIDLKKSQIKPRIERKINTLAKESILYNEEQEKKSMV